MDLDVSVFTEVSVVISAVVLSIFITVVSIYAICVFYWIAFDCESDYVRWNHSL